MKFKAEIAVMPHDALLDPQGKAVHSGLTNLGFNSLNDVRIGKHITLTLEANDEAAALAQAKEACEKLLANPIMEGFRISVHAL
jgi:phosphoribosylformylglycinamidine synthase